MNEFLTSMRQPDEPVLDRVVNRYVVIRNMVAIEAGKIGIPPHQQLSSSEVDGIARGIADGLVARDTVEVREIWAFARECVTKAMRRE